MSILAKRRYLKENEEEKEMMESSRIKQENDISLISAMECDNRSQLSVVNSQLLIDSSKRTIQIIPSKSTVGVSMVNTWSRRLKSLFCDMFLPIGYPVSVSKDYKYFQAWDTLQALCSYLRSVLATQSVLESVGVGKANVSPLAAALQWIMRDGSGMLGGLFFVFFVGHKFDVDVKMWRLFADVINDVGLTLDMISPLFPNQVTEILCISAICKAMCGVAAGSTRSSLTAHFAKQDNMADIAAKEGSQETAVTLFGLCFGMYFANLVNSSRGTIWFSFILLTVFHVGANYQGVSALQIPSINQQRGQILVRKYRALCHGSKENKLNDERTIEDQLSVEKINQEEKVRFLPWNSTSSIVMGARLTPNLVDHQLDRIISLFSQIAYPKTFYGYNTTITFTSLYEFFSCITFTSLYQTRDKLKAFYNACLVQDLKKEISFKSIQETLLATTNEFPHFISTLESLHWKLDSLSFGPVNWLYDNLSCTTPRFIGEDL